MRQCRFFMTLILLLGCTLWAAASAEPVNPHASPEARALLAYLASLSGTGTVTGQHNFPNDGSRWTDRAYDLTGKYPGLFGQDFGFSAGDDKDSVLSRPAMIAEVRRQYEHGALIALTWHAVRPTEDEPVTFRDSVQGHLTDYEWHELLTPGTPLYNRWCAQVDVVAGYLRQLRDAHIPVLFRAYHEINGAWFWWGGRPGRDGSSALYRQIFDRFVNVHHLDNLVWVWNVNAPSSAAMKIEDYYPGPEYADVVSMDIYGEFKQEFYDSTVALAAGKPVALAEVGALPGLDVLDRQPGWTYFMVWSGLAEASNTLDRLNAVYHAPRMINRDDPRLAAPMLAIRNAAAQRALDGPSAEPVSPGADRAAQELLTRLVRATGQEVLSGQQYDVASAGAASASVTQTTGKLPAILGTELAVDSTPGANSSTSPEPVVQVALRAHANKAVVSLSWRPGRPTDDAPAAGHGQLTDFEWNELLTPGTGLNTRWSAQVDAAAAVLRQLEKAGVAVLWNPYPEANGKDFWWSGRKGLRGSAGLYRMLFDRLVNHDGLRNLVWVWEATRPEFGPGAGPLSDYFPGLLYVDALEIKLRELAPHSRIEGFFAELAVGKVLGVELAGELPQPAAFAERAPWAWFLVDPAAAADPAARAAALQALYGNSRVASLPLPQ